MTKSVTILSTIKNIGDTARLWIDSLVSQEYDNQFNIVIIDSFSVDGTRDIIDKYVKNYDIICVREVKSSQPQALNYAIENNLLSGDLVALIDGDCIAPSEWLRTLVDILEKENVDAVGGPGLTPKTANTIQRIIGFDLDARFLSNPPGYVLRHPNMNLLVKKNVLIELKFNEELLSGYDADFGYRLNEKGYKLWYSPSAYVWHSHRSSINKYIKQQFFTGRYAVKLYTKIRTGLAGDEINPLSMTLQPVVFGFLLVTLPLGLVVYHLYFIPIVLFILLILLLSLDVIKAYKINKNPMVLLLYFVYMVRIPTWIAGAIYGILREI